MVSMKKLYLQMHPKKVCVCGGGERVEQIHK